MKLPSASKIHLALACPASLILPRVRDVAGDEAELGTDLHQFLEDAGTAARDGRDGSSFLDLERVREIALANVAGDSKARERCEVVNLAAMPWTRHDLYEAGFTLNARTGAVRFEGCGLKHGAIEPGDDEIPGVFDRVLDVPDEDLVEVDDYKSGNGDLPRPNLSPQLLTGAAMAAAHFGRSRARVRYLRILEDGEPRPIGPVVVDAFDLGMHKARLAALPETAREQAIRRATGEPLSFTTGKHCTYCPSFAFCRAQTAIVHELAEPLNVEATITEYLAGADMRGEVALAARAVERFEEVEATVKRIRRAINAYALNRPIVFPDGTEYGPIDVTRDALDGEKVFETLKRVAGDSDLAALAVKKKATKKGIREVAKRLATKRTDAAKAADPKAKKVAIVDVEKEIHGFLESDGAKTKKTTKKLRRYKPGATIDVGDDDDGDE